MPSEIFDIEKFIDMSANAKYCQVKRNKENVKLKLRTPSRLYTLKVEPINSDEIIKKLKCEIQELWFWNIKKINSILFILMKFQNLFLVKSLPIETVLLTSWKKY